MADLTLPTPLVSTEWLAAHLGHPELVLLDASLHLPAAGRNARAEYEAGHIPGAVFAEIDWLSEPGAPFPHTLPSTSLLAERLGALGVSRDRAVVVYDASGQHFSAPRLWYLLRTHGHARVAVLDGGLPKWVREGRAMSHEVPVPAPAHFESHPDPSRWHDLASMRALVASQGAQVVDARSPSRFAATEPEPRAGVRGGHMPGAANVHYASLLGPDGTMLPPDTLRARFAEAGVDPSRPIVGTCGSGVTACAVMLALDVLGAPHTAVYDGSWTEWGSQPDTPVVP
jgi:thiosulfate/3-mercaptopyruvate sulfurtransferase